MYSFLERRFSEVTVAAEDRAYYQRRAEAETELARKAVDAGAAQAHRELAEAYRGKLANAEPAPAS